LKRKRGEDWGRDTLGEGDAERGEKVRGLE